VTTDSEVPVSGSSVAFVLTFSPVPTTTASEDASARMPAS
jgi:hypothetical protein